MEKNLTSYSFYIDQEIPGGEFEKRMAADNISAVIPFSHIDKYADYTTPLSRIWQWRKRPRKAVHPLAKSWQRSKTPCSISGLRPSIDGFAVLAMLNLGTSSLD